MICKGLLPTVADVPGLTMLLGTSGYGA